MESALGALAVPGRGLGGEAQSCQGVHDEVEPQELHGLQGLSVGGRKRGADECRSQAAARVLGRGLGGGLIWRGGEVGADPDRRGGAHHRVD